MSNETIEKIIANSDASLRMEGLIMDDDCKEWCRKLLRKEINYEEYLQYAKRRIGVKVP